MLKLPLFSILDIDHCNLAKKEVVDASKMTQSALSGQLVRFNTQHTGDYVKSIWKGRKESIEPCIYRV